MIYLLITILLFAALLLYFRIADKYNIIDKPNQRSSHTTITLRGGGVIFPIAMLLWFLFFGSHEPLQTSVALLTGTLAIAFVSFWDDVSSLSNKIRISVHLIAVSLMLYGVSAFTLWPAWALVLCYILIIGTINAYNFMDGINGFTGVYSLTVLLSCLYFNREVQPVANDAYIIIPAIACLVFLFFNFRKKAKCFAGDVGSVSIGFWIISILLLILLGTGDLKYIFFVAVYGVDVVLTIAHRLLLRQNIFEAHRLHFYQILANERKVSHLIVSAAYGLLQLAINAFIICSHYNFAITGLTVCVPLALIYIFVKPLLMKPRIIA